MQQQTNLALKATAWFFVQADDEMQESVPIKAPFQIGRDPEADLYLPCTSVSGEHAEIVEEDGRLWVQDLQSTNGTFVNGLRINSKTCLKENDTVQFGTTVFQIAHDADDDDLTKPTNQDPVTHEINDDRLKRLFSGEIVPFFQPIVRLNDNDQPLFGYEVLGRSRLFGLRTPAQMFAAASRLEMEAELSRVLRTKGIKVADKHLAKNMVLFVNTHPAELECEGLEESLFEMRDNYPDRPIMLELHESVLNATDKLVRLGSTLQNLDIQLAFHNFGAGQIQLAELGEICPDVVKFDVSLVQGIDRASSKRQQFVGSLVKMVTELGIVPVAECIEQPGEHETIRQLGFQLGQGFHYGRPSSITDCNRPRAACVSEPLVKSFLKDSPRNETLTQVEPEIVAAVPRNADWLLEQPENKYTIQVLSAISQQRAEEYVATQANPDQFAIFSKQGKTRELYIVVYGVFEDRSAAKAASQKLADHSISPWIRMLSGVHAEINLDVS